MKRVYYVLFLMLAIAVFLAGCDEAGLTQTKDEATLSGPDRLEAETNHYLRDLPPQALALHDQMAQDPDVRAFLVASSVSAFRMSERFDVLSKREGEVGDLVRQLLRPGAHAPEQAEMERLAEVFSEEMEAASNTVVPLAQDVTAQYPALEKLSAEEQQQLYGALIKTLGIHVEKSSADAGTRESAKKP